MFIIKLFSRNLSKSEDHMGDFFGLRAVTENFFQLFTYRLPRPGGGIFAPLIPIKRIFIFVGKIYELKATVVVAIFSVWPDIGSINI